MPVRAFGEGGEEKHLVQREAVATAARGAHEFLLMQRCEADRRLDGHVGFCL